MTIVEAVPFFTIAVFALAVVAAYEAILMLRSAQRDVETLATTVVGLLMWFTASQAVAAANSLALALGITYGTNYLDIRSAFFIVQELILIGGLLWGTRRIRRRLP